MTQRFAGVPELHTKLMAQICCSRSTGTVISLWPPHKSPWIPTELWRQESCTDCVIFINNYSGARDQNYGKFPNVSIILSNFLTYDSSNQYAVSQQEVETFVNKPQRMFQQQKLQGRWPGSWALGASPDWKLPRRWRWPRGFSTRNWITSMRSRFCWPS